MVSDEVLIFFFKQKTAYEMRISDWSSDVCSSDLVAVVGRVEHDHLVAGTHDCVDGVEDRLGRAAGNGDLGVRVRSVAVDALCLGRDRVAQRRDAGHRRVLVVAVAHRTIELIDQTHRYGKLREPIPEVDRAMLGGELRHDGKDRSEARRGGKEGGSTV